MLIRISAPHFVAGLIYSPEKSRVTRAAPILRWSIGKSREELFGYFERKGWQAEVICEEG